MKPRLCLLLPFLGIEDLELFEEFAAAALLAPLNLPAVAETFQPTLCVLASRAVIARFEQSARTPRLRQHAQVCTIAIDDLALDHPFAVLSSLAYLRGISECQESLTKTAFVFLQPNLVLGDGALSNVARRLADGAQAITATYLRATRVRIAERLRAEERGGKGFHARSLARHAIECLDIGDLTNVVNSELRLLGPAGRFFWRHDPATLLARDFCPSLIALRPSRAPAAECGFRDTAFAASMAPDARQQHFTDSDEFLGVELTDSMSGTINVGRRGVEAAARELWWSTASQRSAALDQPTVFHCTDVPPGLSRTAAKAQEYVGALAIRLGAPASPLDDPRWRVLLYLWALRRFELGRGPLPDAPFTSLFGDPERSVEAAGRGSGQLGLAALTGLARWLRRRLLGQAPRVSFLHPEWRTYRRMQPVLRSVAEGDPALLYVGDDVSTLRRVLGAPAFTSVEVLDQAFDPGRPDNGTVDLVVLEPAAKRLSVWGEIVSKVLPSVRPGGQILFFYRNVGRASVFELRNALIRGAIELNQRDLKRLSISIEKNSHYAIWLNWGYSLALGYARKRRPLSLLYGAALLAVCSILTLAHNLVDFLPTRDEAAVEMWSSITIVIDV
jgi:hypothetical protein